MHCLFALLQFGSHFISFVLVFSLSENPEPFCLLYSTGRRHHRSDFPVPVDFSAFANCHNCFSVRVFVSYFQIVPLPPVPKTTRLTNLFAWHSQSISNCHHNSLSFLQVSRGNWGRVDVDGVSARLEKLPFVFNGLHILQHRWPHVGLRYKHFSNSLDTF